VLCFSCAINVVVHSLRLNCVALPAASRVTTSTRPTDLANRGLVTSDSSRTT
jgi:hypothetical protein